MNRIYNKKKKYIFFSAFALLLFGTTVAFAAISTNLSIGGTINRYGGTWNIYFSNVSASSNSTSAVSHSAKISDADPTTLHISCSFTEGSFYDKITYIITVKNDSDFDAKLASWSTNELASGSELTNNVGIEGTLLYADGSFLNEGDILKAGESVDLELSLNMFFDFNIEEDLFSDFTVSVEYVQA